MYQNFRRWYSAGQHTVRNCRWPVRLAGLSGATAVVMTAYGFHVFKMSEVSDVPELQTRFEKAQLFHLVNSVALLGTPMAKRPALAASLIGLGTFAFCGNLYWSAIKQDRTFAGATPLGGILLILGWASMIL